MRSRRSAGTGGDPTRRTNTQGPLRVGTGPCPMPMGGPIGHRRAMTTTENETRPQEPSTNPLSGKRPHRSRNQRMFSGVSGGIAEYAGIDPTIVRLGFVITSFFGGAGIVAYAVAWLIIPQA